jgi:hypothetical protein
LWIGWACGRRPRLGLLSSFGSKRLLGGFGLGWVFKSGNGLGWVRSRAGSKRLGFRPDFKKASEPGLDLTSSLGLDQRLKDPMLFQWVWAWVLVRSQSQRL